MICYYIAKRTGQIYPFFNKSKKYSGRFIPLNIEIKQPIDISEARIFYKIYGKHGGKDNALEFLQHNFQINEENSKILLKVLKKLNLLIPCPSTKKEE